MDRLVAADAVREWAPRGFKEFASTNALYAIGTRGLPWIEIDTLADYRRAVSEVVPAIDGWRVSPGRSPAIRGQDRCTNDFTTFVSGRSR
jgi:hypothetical protein